MHFARLLELAQGLDKGRQLHPVVGGAGVAAAELFFVHFAIEPIPQHRAPAAGAGVAAARAVGVNFNLFHAFLPVCKFLLLLFRAILHVLSRGKCIDPARPAKPWN